MNKMKIALSLDELKKRTSKTYLTKKVLLKKDAPEYNALKDGDKAALKHLVTMKTTKTSRISPLSEHHGSFS